MEIRKGQCWSFSFFVCQPKGRLPVHILFSQLSCVFNDRLPFLQGLKNVSMLSERGVDNWQLTHGKVESSDVKSLRFPSQIISLANYLKVCLSRKLSSKSTASFSMSTQQNSAKTGPTSQRIIAWGEHKLPDRKCVILLRPLSRLSLHQSTSLVVNTPILSHDIMYLLFRKSQHLP